MALQVCKHCGEETVDIEKCGNCNQASKFLCPECNVIFEDFHADCGIVQKITNS